MKRDKFLGQDPTEKIVFVFFGSISCEYHLTIFIYLSIKFNYQ